MSRNGARASSIGRVSGTVIVDRMPRSIGSKCGVNSRSQSAPRVARLARISNRCRCELPTPYGRKFSVTSAKSSSSLGEAPAPLTPLAAAMFTVAPGAISPAFANGANATRMLVA